MSCLCQVGETLLVHWQSFAKMNLSVIEQSGDAPMHQVDIDATIVQNDRCDAPCVPTLLTHVIPTIYRLSMVLKHPMKWIFPPIFSFTCSTWVHSRWMRCEFSYGIPTSGFALASFDTDQLIFVQRFALSIRQWASSCWASSSSVRIACIILFPVRYNAPAPSFPIAVLFSGASGGLDNYNIIC